MNKKIILKKIEKIKILNINNKNAKIKRLDRY